MGKGKKPGDLGRALMRRSRNDKKERAKAARSTGFHVADIGIGTNKLQSITEMSSLEDFMSNAVLSDRNFVSQRESFKMIGASDERIGRPDSAEQPRQSAVQPLQIPRRPPWDESMSKEELQKLENDSFLDWRSEIAQLEQANTHNSVTPFEKNIAVWRQLWRVVERSDVIIQVVDSRNPLMFRCPDLEHYVKEINSNKELMLVVNKADFLSPPERLKWGAYFDQLGINYVFFSAKLEGARLEEAGKHFAEAMETGEGGPSGEIDEKHTSLSSNNDKAKLFDRESLIQYLHDKYDHLIEADTSGQLSKRQQEVTEARRQKLKVSGHPGAAADEHDISAPMDPFDPHQALNPRTSSRISESEKQMLESEIGVGAEAATFAGLTDSKGRRKGGVRGGFGKKAKAAGVAGGMGIELSEEHIRWVNGVPVVDMSLAAKAIQAASDGQDPNAAISAAKDVQSKRDGHSMRNSEKDDADFHKLIIGMVGYPNVGKSSLINVLLGVTSGNHKQLRVAVSSTPGKTRHFQTLPLDHGITLCDCPGLVFPSFVASKGEMVCNGMLPLSQLRDHVEPMSLVLKRIPRHVFEHEYGIKLPLPSYDEDANRQPTMKELLDTFCHARGFMASVHSGPDHPRAARVILRDYVTGKLVYCHPPPGQRTRELPQPKPRSRDKTQLQFTQVAPECVPLKDGVSSTSDANLSFAVSSEHTEATHTHANAQNSDDAFIAAAFGSKSTSHEIQPSNPHAKQVRWKSTGKKRSSTKKGRRDPDPYGTQIEPDDPNAFLLHKEHDIRQKLHAYEDRQKHRGPVLANIHMRSG